MVARRVVFVVNPKAGRRAGVELAFRFATARRALGESCEVQPTEFGGHAIEIAQRVEADVLVVIGGDGTLREVAAGLGARRAEVPVVFIPSGHGNVVAREFGIALDDPDAALRALDGSRERRLDVGIANGHPFLAMVGVGFDVLATRFVDRARRTTIGRRLYDAPRGGDFLYGIGGAMGLFRILPTRFSSKVDGADFTRRSPTITVCNTRTYAKGWAIAPGAIPDDGLLDLTALRFCFAPLQLLALLYARARRRMPGFLAQHARGRHIAITSSRPFSWQLDGDPMEEVPALEIGIAPPQLRVLLPDGSGVRQPPK